VLVIGLFILTFLGQNFVIPSGSMERRCWWATICWWIASPRSAHEVDAAVHYREPRRGDIVVFISRWRNLIWTRTGILST